MLQTCQNPSRYSYLRTSSNLTPLMRLGTQAIPMTSEYCLANSSPAELPSCNTKSTKSWQDGRILPSTRTRLTKYQPSSTSPFQFSSKNKTAVWTVCLDWRLTTSTGMLASQTDRRLLLQIKCRPLHLKRILSCCQTNEFVLERQGTIFRTKHCFTSRTKTFLSTVPLLKMILKCSSAFKLTKIKLWGLPRSWLLTSNGCQWPTDLKSGKTAE